MFIHPFVNLVVPLPTASPRSGLVHSQPAPLNNECVRVALYLQFGLSSCCSQNRGAGRLTKGIQGRSSGVKGHTAIGRADSEVMMGSA